MKNSILTIVASLALAAPAAAQVGQFPRIQDMPSSQAMYWNQVNTARVNYAYMTGYDGLAPSFQNPNAYYVTNGLGVVPAWSTAYPYGMPNCGGVYNGPVIINAPVYGGGCGYPVPQPPCGQNGGWSVGIGVGFGGTW